MKLFKYFFRILPVVILTYLTTLSAYGQQNDSTTRISLLTCSPGQEIWAQYGHTAIRVQIPQTNADIVFNYGMFSSRQKYFIPRFVFGLTDYKVAAESFDNFLNEYSYEGRGVTEQVLNISEDDKQKIIAALFENIKPENQTYRYNFFYDNCTSRARDMIANHLHGDIKFPPAKNATFRDMIHIWNNDYPWTQTGEDILLGIAADRKTTKDEQQFLPDNLRDDFDKAIYLGKPLVKETKEIILPQTKLQEDSFPLSPSECGILFVVISTIIAAIEWHRKKYIWLWDAILMVVVGIVGIIPFLMLFSEHPCVRVNFLLLTINPLPLLFVWGAVKTTRRKEPCKWWAIWQAMLILALIGSFFQHEPLLMIFVALSLLIRTILHTTIKNKW